MKQKDIALIIVIVFVSAVVSLLLSNAIFASPKDRKQEVEVVQPISPDLPKPDPQYFNNQAFDPTRTITIDKNANPNPFNSQSPQSQ
jgi:hypothetical protein